MGRQAAVVLYVLALISLGNFAVGMIGLVRGLPGKDAERASAEGDALPV